MAIERLGELLLLDKIAVGGMAEVFLAKQVGVNGFEKTVAVKRVLPNHSASKELQEMFKAEANLSAQLQHPNIAQVFSNGQHNSYFYLVMEYVDGKSLRQLYSKTVERGVGVPHEFTCYVICETAKGLDFAHKFCDEKTGQPLNIIHRDVSHQNIMLAYEGSIKIIDFGVAKISEEGRNNTRAGVLKGKFSYMSPEQVRGKRLDCRADVFALGVVMWELLAGQRLFLDEDDLATLEKVKECNVPKFSEIGKQIPERLECIVRKALAKDLDQRYQSAKDLVVDLQKFINENFPAYLATDASAYLKDVFKDDIVAERFKRDKLNQEVKVFLIKNPVLRPSQNRVLADNLANNNVVHFKQVASLDEEQKTKVSDPLANLQINLPQQPVSQVKEPTGWKHSTGAQSVPKFAYENSSHTGFYESAAQDHSKKIAALLLVIIFGVVYFWFKERERVLFASFESSKNEAWTEDFRASFVQGCISDFKSNGVDSGRFCQCLSYSVEGARILYTKFNPNVITEEAHSLMNLTAFRKFMSEQAGVRAKDDCLTKTASYR